MTVEVKKVANGNINIFVEKVRVDGSGVILLTGPSGCGKGEIAKALCRFLSIPASKHLSMGDILRKTIEEANSDPNFRMVLEKKYCISSNVSIFDPDFNRPELVIKANNYKDGLYDFFGPSRKGFSQLDWLQFCVSNGLLVPDEWTEKIMEALFENSLEIKQGILILDGYPRTVAAAEFLLKTFAKLEIPVIRVLHLFITKEQMSCRALNRKRTDDTQESLERRYQFYIDKVQPCIDYMKSYLGSGMVSLIDAHQPVIENGKTDIEASIHQVVISVMQALGLPGYLMDLK